MRLLPTIPALVVVTLLAGCAAEAAAPAPAPTVTVTAPAPDATAAARTDDSPIDGYDAYYVCLAAVFEFATGTSPAYADGELDFASYSSNIVTAGDDGFRVQLRGEGEAVDSVYCVVSGTVANPTIGDYLYPR